MKEYEMVVKMYDVDTKKLCQVWKGSELFVADNIEDALDDALESERAEHIASGHIYVSTSAALKMVWKYRQPGQGYVAWTSVCDGEEHNMIEDIQMIERSE